MSHTLQVTISLGSIVLLLVPLGLIAKFYWRSLPWCLVPFAGLVMYGGIVVPVLYVVDRYSFALVAGISGALGVVGIVLGMRSLRTLHSLRPRWSTTAMIVGVILLASAIVFSLSRQPVPSGADPAMHSIFMNLVQTSGHLEVKYPLGMHTLLLFSEQLLNINRAYLLQAFGAFLYLNFFSLTYVLLNRISKRPVIAWLGLAAVVLDASFYNNLLNGSITHLLAVDLVAFYLLFLESKRELPSRVSTLLGVVFSVALIYFHFISWYLVIPALWIDRLIHRRHAVQDLALTLVPIALSVPLILRLYDYAGYSEVFRWTTGLIVVVEALLYWFGNRLSTIVTPQRLYSVTAIASVALFIYYRSKIYQYWEAWYGWPMTGIACLGILALALQRRSEWRVYLLLFGVYTALFSAFSWAKPLTENIGVVKELLFFYGFTLPLVLFAAVGLYQLVLFGASRRAQAVKASLIAVFAILIFTSRMADARLVDGGNVVSRYQSNDGFGMFYQASDVQLVDWFRAEIHTSGSVANPGGLYGMWTSMVGRPTVYLGYGAMNIPEPQQSNQEVIDLLTNAASGPPETLLKNNVRYLFVPAALPVDVFHPYLTLIKEFGTSRLYEIQQTPISSDRFVTLRPLLHGTVPGVQLTGEYTTETPYFGQRFYHQFQETIERLILKPEQSILLTIAKEPANRHVTFTVDSAAKALKLTVDGIPKNLRQESSGGRSAEILLGSNRALELTVQNAGDAPVSIDNLIVRFSAELPSENARK